MTQTIKDKARTVRAKRERREVREMQDKAIRKLAQVHQLLIDLRQHSDKSPHADRYNRAVRSVGDAYEQIYASLTPPRATHLRLVE